MQIVKQDSEDAIWWPCGTWCFRHELPEMQHKSDDFNAIPFGTPEYDQFIELHG